MCAIDGVTNMYCMYAVREQGRVPAAMRPMTSDQTRESRASLNVTAHSVLSSPRHRGLLGVLHVTTYIYIYRVLNIDKNNN